MTRELEGSVVVITGASSGLGAASARAFASHHTSLVLAARTEAALTAVGAECELAGARSVLVVPTLLVRDDAADHTAGALFDAVSEGNSTGGWRRWDLRRTLGDAFGRSVLAAVVSPTS